MLKNGTARSLCKDSYARSPTVLPLPSTTIKNCCIHKRKRPPFWTASSSRVHLHLGLTCRVKPSFREHSFTRIYDHFSAIIKKAQDSLLRRKQYIWCGNRNNCRNKMATTSSAVGGSTLSNGGSHEQVVVETCQTSELAQSKIEKNFVNFAVGQPSPRLLPLRAFGAACAERFAANGADSLMLQYGAVAPPNELATLADWLTSRTGSRVQPEELIFTSGNSHAVRFALQNLKRIRQNQTEGKPHRAQGKREEASAGDSYHSPVIVMDDPTYFLVGDIVLEAGFRVHLIPCSSSIAEEKSSSMGMGTDGASTLTAGLDSFVDRIESWLINNGQDENDKQHGRIRPEGVYLIPVHHNPTGGSLSEAGARKLVRLAEEYDFYILSDEPYALLHFLEGDEGNHKVEVEKEGEVVENNISSSSSRMKKKLTKQQEGIGGSLRRFDDHGRVLAMGSFSKIVAPGLRLGWIHAAPSVIQSLRRDPVLLSGGSMNPVASYAVSQMIRNGQLDAHLSLLEQEYTTRAHTLFRELRSVFNKEGKSDLIEFVDPEGGYFVWVRFLDGTSTTKLQKFAVDNRYGFSFLPGPRCAVAGAQSGSTGTVDRPSRFDSYLRLAWSFYEPHELKEGVRRLHTAWIDFKNQLAS
ncbi:unnamed protein product [Amoebophrya sp. A25]|nr:unnamed protein product [Amoebophrya sp. A25]|eukprot:GSA25T00013349001.1